MYACRPPAVREPVPSQNGALECPWRGIAPGGSRAEHHACFYMPVYYIRARIIIMTPESLVLQKDDSTHHKHTAMQPDFPELRYTITIKKKATPTSVLRLYSGKPYTCQVSN